MSFSGGRPDLSSSSRISNLQSMAASTAGQSVGKEQGRKRISLWGHCWSSLLCWLAMVHFFGSFQSSLVSLAWLGQRLVKHLRTPKISKWLTKHSQSQVLYSVFETTITLIGKESFFLLATLLQSDRCQQRRSMSQALWFRFLDETHGASPHDRQQGSRGHHKCAGKDTTAVHLRCGV